jgi:hypothetical protein
VAPRRAAGRRNRLSETAVALVSRVAWRLAILTARHNGRASLRVFITGKVGFIRKSVDKNILRGIDLSERAIVPIVSFGNTDPALIGSASRTEANQTVNRLPFPTA